ncbi:MAG: hypothetical protein KAU21_02425, partial [Gammaproteobacteria bacterium]|nr:hypothetical protein [Gammaproteobacteria bacterium]
MLLVVVVCIASIFWTDVSAGELDQKTINQPVETTSIHGAASLKPRWTQAKPLKTTLKPWHDQNRVIVKFAEGSQIRLRSGGLVSLNGRDLGQLTSVFAKHRIKTNGLRRYFTRPEQSLDQEKARGEARSRRQLADLNLYFNISVGANIDVGQLCDDLNALDNVELAEPAPTPAPLPIDLPPQTPVFSGQQGYRDAAPGGIGISNNQSINGIDGTGMAFVDVEYNWVLDHEDLELLASANIDSATLDDSFDDDGDHGTAVLGVIAGGDNGYGVVGIAPAA